MVASPLRSATAADGATPAGLAASFIPRLRAHPNVIVLRTFSKSYSMAGAVMRT